MRLIFAILFISIPLLSPKPLFAQIPQEFQERIQNFQREYSSEGSTQFQYSNQGSTGSGDINDFKQKLEEFREQVKSQNEKFRQDYEAARQKQKEEFDKQRQEFKEALKAFKDQTRALLAQQINENLRMINLTMNDAWVMQLDLMADILADLEERVKEAEAAGRDTQEAQAAIDQAKQVLADARSAVETQAQKTYTVEVTSEYAIGQDLRKVRNQMNLDLKAVHIRLKQVKEAIQNAVSVVNSTLGSFAESEEQSFEQ